MITENIKKLLIFRPGHLGDTIAALPAIWSLRRKLADAEFFCLYNVDRQHSSYVTPMDVLDGSGLVDRWIAYPHYERQRSITRAASKVNLLLKIRAARFDAVAYLMPRERSIVQIERDVKFFRVAGIRKCIGVEHLLRIADEWAVGQLSERVASESSFLLDCVVREGFDIVQPENSDWLNIGDQESEQIFAKLQLPRERGSLPKFVAVAPGSKRPSRMWSEDRFASVVAKLSSERGIEPIYFGSYFERELCDRIAAKVGSGHNTAGLLTIRESAALLKGCRFYLGNDTGTMHLAAAVGTPCVAVFSAADRNGQWEPLGEGHRILRRSVECEGCRIDVCPRENLCLSLIETDDVLRSCFRIIDSQRFDR